MIDQLKTNNPVKKYNFVTYPEQCKQADQHLSRITMLQEQLNIEEAQLLQLLKDCGVGVLPPSSD